VIAVAPDVLDGLTTDLLGVAADLTAEADECERAGGLLATAVDGALADRAASVGRAWSRLLQALSEQVATVSAALYTVTGEYRAADAARAQELGDPAVAVGAGPR